VLHGQRRLSGRQAVLERVRCEDDLHEAGLRGL
jgi:hypothetical protein